MDILAIIDKKRLKQQLSYEELDKAFNAYLNKKIPKSDFFAPFI